MNGFSKSTVVVLRLPLFGYKLPHLFTWFIFSITNKLDRTSHWQPIVATICSTSY